MIGGTSGDEGMVAGIDAVVLGILLFVMGTLMVANAWAVIDAKLAVEAAAREATRAFVESPSTETGWESAKQAAATTVAGHGRDPARVVLRSPAAEVRRCAAVTFEASYPVQMVPLRLLGRTGGQLTVTGRHSERVDAHRSGLAGAAPC